MKLSEEYGEHKTFHDEHRESDQKKKYHDEHQDYTHHGGKQFKQHANKGHYDENKHGEDFHKFGKAGHESNREGAFKKGGHHHAAADRYKQEGGKYQSQAHAHGHHSEGNFKLLYIRHVEIYTVKSPNTDHILMEINFFLRISIRSVHT